MTQTLDAIVPYLRGTNWTVTTPYKSERYSITLNGTRYLVHALRGGIWTLYRKDADGSVHVLSRTAYENPCADGIKGLGSLFSAAWRHANDKVCSVRDTWDKARYPSLYNGHFPE